jgi:hypothetical protein
MSEKKFKFHLYDLSCMGGEHSPEYYESDHSNLDDAIAEVIDLNRETWSSVGDDPMIHGTHFRLVPLQKFRVSDDLGNEAIQWAENRDQAGRLFLEETFLATVEPA